MEKLGFVITILIGIIIGIIIAICNNWIEWWQIVLCILSATCVIFILLGMLMVYSLYYRLVYGEKVVEKAWR